MIPNQKNKKSKKGKRGRPRKKAVTGKQFLNNIVSTVLIFAVLLTLYSFVVGNFEEPEEMTLSELAQGITSGEVVAIAVEGEDLKITLDDESERISKKEVESSLSETLGNYGVLPEALSNVAIEIKNPSGFGYWTLNLLPFLLPLLFLGFIIWFMTKQAKGAGMQALSFGQSNARVIDPNDKSQKVRFSDVAGVKEAKEELTEIVDFLKNPKKFLDIGARVPKGVLLMGAPGTGKTLLARAVAGEANVPFFIISGSEFVEMFVGVGASRVRDLFKLAKKAAPAIIFIDEIDAVGRARGAGMGGGNDEREQTLNQILVEMDGFEPQEKVIVMAATNRPDVLDPALLRPGRFDRRVVLDLPDRADREEILGIHAQKKPLAEDVDLKVIAERTPGFSGADLYSLMNEGAILAAREERNLVSQFDLIRSIEKVMLGPERKSRIISKREKKITAYHEAGYAAELMMFDDITTGPSHDLSVATALARDMVGRYGMSDVIGPVAFESAPGKRFLGTVKSEGEYSDEVAATIDKEVTRIITEALARAKESIEKHKDAFEAITTYLLEKETIERKEYEDILRAHGIALKEGENEEGV
jgi:cell division protease FtsH